MKRVLVPLAPGFEEIEAVTVIDLLRRADVEVVVAGVERGPIAGSRGVRLLPDASLDDVAGASFDLVVLPGGRGGTDRLIADSRVHALLRDQVRAGRLVAAICAAPEVLHRAGLLEGRQVTSHPSSRDALPGVRYREDRVVRDGSIITSRAPGTAMEFAFTLVELLCGKEKVREINAVVLGRLDPERNIT
jgi:4-methyl-5(b-hydroxyethyl)-thiazole monophosphate biosynthesis